jgi:WD40 repeat protein
MPDVFISYSRRDLEFVQRLHASLDASGKDVWVDWQDILPTAEWLEEVFEGVESSDNFLFVISPDSLTSEVCARELGHALEQRKRLVPVLRRDADREPMPEALAARNWTFFRDQDDYGASFETLVSALDTDLEWVSAHTRLLGRALEWERKGRDGSYLLRGRDLADAERWVASQTAERDPQPTPLQLEYTLEGRRAATRRQRVLVGAALVAVAVSLSLALLALFQRNEARREARIALSRQLAAEALVALDTDPEQSLVLAARAATTAHTNQAADALRQALRSSRLRTTIDAGAPVVNAAVDPTGRLAAAALEDGSIHTWTLRTGKPEATLQLARVPAEHVQFSHDGRRLLGAGKGGIVVWSTGVGRRRPVATFDAAGQPLAAAFSPNRKLVATGDFDGAVRLWRTETGVLRQELRPPGMQPVRAVSFSGDGTVLAAAKGSRAVVWTLRTKRPRVFRANRNAVWAVAVSPDGKHVATGDVGGLARVWNLRSGAVELNGHSGPITSLAFSPDGRSLVTASDDETARIWDVGTGRSLAELRGHGDIVESASFAPNGKAVVTGGDDGTIRVWAAASDPISAELAAGDDRTLRDVEFDPSGERVVAASEDLTAPLWNVESGRLLRALGHAQRADEWVERAGFSHDGRLVVTAGNDGTAKVWTSFSGALLATLGQPGDRSLYDAALSPDGRLIATAGQAGAGDETVIRLWRWRQRKQVMTRGGFGQRADGVAFSPTGALLAGAGQEKVRVWRAADGASVAVLHGRGELTSVAFDASGTLIAAGSSSGAALLWDLPSRKRIAVLTGHSDTVAAVAFSADGQFLATAGHDGIAKVWTVPGGDLVTTLRPRVARLEGVAFAPRGRRVAVAGAGGRVTVFDCAECRPLHSLVCLAASRVTHDVRAREEDAFRRCD